MIFIYEIHRTIATWQIYDVIITSEGRGMNNYMKTVILVIIKAVLKRNTSDSLSEENLYILIYLSCKKLVTYIKT